MTALSLNATAFQRKNIATLLCYMRQQLVARNVTYNHNYMANCTIGFAIRARLFKALNRYDIIKHPNGWSDQIVHYGTDRAAQVSEVVLRRLFGRDYVEYIVFPHHADFQPYRSSNIASLRYVIKNIAKLYGMDDAASVNPEKCALAVEADELRAKATARVAELEELVKSCEVVYLHSPLDTVKQIKAASITELRILQNLLEK